MGVNLFPTLSSTPPTRVGWDAPSLGPARPVAQARRRTAVWVREQWGLPELADQAELVVSELSSNAIRHGNGLAGLELFLNQATEYRPPCLRVLVTDNLPTAHPHISDPDGGLHEYGRGLQLVVAIALRWGWHRFGCDQKQVWCTLRIPNSAPHPRNNGHSAGNADSAAEGLFS